MSDVGILRTTIGIESLTRRGEIHEIASVMVDTGSEYTWLPRSILMALDEVVFADEGDMTLLGAHTIEGMNLRVDLKSKRLMPAGPVPAAAAA